MELAEFITARLDEIEGAAREAIDAIEEHSGAFWSDVFDAYNEAFLNKAEANHIGRHNPERVLREVDAMRKILQRCAAFTNEPDQYPNGLVSPRAVLARQNLMDLGAIWNDHPDYNLEWRP